MLYKKQINPFSIDLILRTDLFKSSLFFYFNFIDAFQFVCFYLLHLIAFKEKFKKKIINSFFIRTIQYYMGFGLKKYFFSLKMVFWIFNLSFVRMVWYIKKFQINRSVKFLFYKSFFFLYWLSYKRSNQSFFSQKKKFNFK